MATVTKTWSFPTDAMGLVKTTGSASITFAWVSADQAIQFSTASRNFSGNAAVATPDSTDTWETWGVPAGSTVTGIRLAGWKSRLAANVGLTSATLQFEVVDSFGTSLTNPTLYTATLATTPTATTYTAGPAGSLQSVTATFQPSNSYVRLQLFYTEATGTAQSPNVKYLFDDIAYEITYTPPAGGGGAAAAQPAALLMAL